jgi:hypothetical protein
MRNTAGFIVLPSLESTFSCARKEIEECELLGHTENGGSKPFRFVHPRLRPISRKQEVAFGSLLAFFQKTSSDFDIGRGTANKPLELLVQMD